MRPAIFIGVVLAALILAAGVFAPYFAEQRARSTAAAWEQTDAVRRDLQRVNLRAVRLASTLDANSATIEGPALESAAASAAEQLKTLSEQWGRTNRSAAERIRQAGLTPPSVAAPKSDPAGMQRAISGMQTSLAQDAKRIDEIVRAAQSISSIEATAIGGDYTAGMVLLTRAMRSAILAQHAAAEQFSEQSTLVSLATRWAATRARADYFRALDSKPVIDALRGDLDELASLKRSADQRAGELAEELAARERELESLAAELASTREALAAHETDGFEAGSDSSFAAYRLKHAELSATLQEIEAREHALRFGARVGAELSSQDIATAEILGGEPGTPVSVLRERSSIASDRAERLSGGNVDLDAFISRIQDIGQRAVKQGAEYDAAIADLLARQKSSLERLASLAAAASGAEDAALKDAEAAARAFGKASAAVKNWVSAARQLQSSRDPAGANERLKRLTRDPYIDQVGASAEAAAQVFIARWSADRIDRVQRLLTDMRLFGEINPDPSFTFDPAPFQELATNAQTAGMAAAEKARTTYERLSSAPPNTKWVALGALAAAQHVSARLDPTQAQAYRDSALAKVDEAVKDAEQNPLLARYVQLRDHLRGPEKPSTDTAPADGEGEATDEGAASADGADPNAQPAAP